MLELGGQAPELHWDLGREAAKAGLEDVIYVGRFGPDFEKAGGLARCFVHPSTAAATRSRGSSRTVGPSRRLEGAGPDAW
jgi:UDP-N-acetylmuramyl pentapeptide synthase